MVIGLVRVAVGTADGTGTLVNTAWVIYDLVVLSVIIEAARYRGPSPAPADTSTIRTEGHNEYSDNSN